MAGPDSDTDPDMPELLPVEQGRHDPGLGKCRRPASTSVQLQGLQAALGKFGKTSRKPATVAPTRVSESAKIASKILSRMDYAEMIKASGAWHHTSAAQHDFATEGRHIPSLGEIHTVAGGYSCEGTPPSCARVGCEKPARGTGGTSKYCSLACMNADESDDEEKEEEVVEQKWTARRPVAVHGKAPPLPPLPQSLPFRNEGLLE
eukprot:TRINITY_DN31685_c0_g1_i1.p1 TRINITY_DN31685_c0_g1~~TRINITY_DN31685_c0_g1_i1.p1  ORF type:complete len:205 (+),score=27.69 TRINITY_DN31685_c0_g1_i1:44-658(+)